MIGLDLYRQGIALSDRASRFGGLVSDGRRAGDRIGGGFAGLHRQGLAARRTRHTIVGGALYHTVGDRADAVKQLGIDFAQFQNDLAAQLGWRVDAPAVDETNPLTPWWRINVVPVLDAWQKFQTAEAGSWFERFTTNWDEFDRWRDRLVEIRDAAQKAGFHLASPEPAPLPRTVWEQAGAGLSDSMKAIWQLIRTVVYVGMVVAGAALLIAVIGRARGGF